ncbi:MAG: C25 family cysteine peptidase, partial [Bacteroidales bacterium]|nr:C25 family cysteine peptidase [Bacteroidales bacterium]
MKKCFTWIALIFSVLSLNAGVIEKTYYFSDYSVKNHGNYQTIAFPNSLLTGLEGEPALPYCAVSLILPPGQSAESIEFIGVEETGIEGYFQLYPQQAVRPISLGSSGKFLKNESVYSMDAGYPVKQTGQLSTQYMNGFAFVHSTFTPVRYNPAKGTVTFYKQVTIRIKTKTDSKSATALKNITSNPEILQSVKGLSQNPEAINQYPTRKSRTDDYQMMIITPSSFETAYQSLIDMYKTRGIKALTVTKEYILANMTGQDDAEKVRNYIIQEYQAHAVEYVLLGGDVDLIPYRGFYCYVQSGSGYEDYGIPADLYFSALDGNWNTNGDSKWGEPGEDDLLPEVSVARFTVGNLSELNNMLNKSISYQSTPVLGDMKHPLLAGEHLYDDPNTEGSQYLELLIGHHEDNGYTTDGITPDNAIDKMYDETNYWSASDLINRFNQGRAFLYHSGHANETYVMKLSNSDITNANFSQVNGIIHNFTFVSTHGCNCGAFDYSDCIAEKMVNISNFAAGFIGNSRYGWFNEGQTEGPSAHLQREFTDALYGDGYLRIGKAHAESKAKTAPWVTAPGQWEPGALRWNFYDCNLLGDPALSLWTIEPMTVQANYQAALPLGVPTLAVSVTSGGSPVPLVNCVLIKDNVAHGIAGTDASGNAVIAIDPPFAEVGEAQLIISGNNCLPQTFPVTIIPNEGAFVISSSQTINDSLGNNNGLMDYNDTILLTLTMKNVGSVPVSNVNVALSTADSYITINDAIENYGNIAANDSVTIPFGFKFTVASNIPDNHLTPFEVVASDGTNSWTTDITLIAHAPVFQVGTMTISDPNGNNNGRLDPGETADVTVTATNTGSSTAINAMAMLNNPNGNMTINTPSIDLGNVVPGVPVSATFNVTVDPSSPVGSVADLNYSITSGDYSAEKTFSVKIGLVLEDFESGGFTQFPWAQGGNQPWSITNVSPYEGLYSAKSGAISHSQNSDLSIQLDVSIADSISFFLKTSSESNYDFLKFFLDGTSIGEWSGETDWTRAAFPVTAGNHTFKWEYMKDGSVSNGSDCAWIDYIVFPATGASGVSVSGEITYANTANTPLGGLTVNLKNSGGATIGTTTTNAAGNYSFTSVPSGSYTFEVSTTKPWNGVSAADVLLYGKHIANIELLSGIYLNSGDVNASATLTASDVLLIKKRIAVIINSFPTGDWLFNNTPFVVGSADLTQDFNGIVFGDANGSYIPAASKSVPVQKGMIRLVPIASANEGFVVPVTVSDMPDLGSFQFTVQYDPSRISLKEVSDWYPGIEEAFIGTPAPGLITVVWAADVHGISINDGILCKLHFVSTTENGSALAITGNPTPVEFTDYEGNVFEPSILKSADNSNFADE